MTAKPAHTNDELMERLEQLGQELQLLQNVLDELRSEIQWAARNGCVAVHPAPLRITSMPLDPLTEDWSQRLNRCRPEDLSGEDPAFRPTAQQQELW